MPKIISIHSFRPGTGKSNIAANIATILAATGQRIGIIDTDLHSPAIPLLFGIDERIIEHSLNDFLWGKCSIEDTAYDVSHGIDAALSGRVFLIPFVTRPGNISYDVSLLSDSFQLLVSALSLDVLLIDSQPGLEEANLPSLAFADVQVLVLRPDEQDYQGTGVTIDVVQQLGVPAMMLVVNQVPASLTLTEVQRQVEKVYGYAVIAVVPHSSELAALANTGLFVVHYPEHPITRILAETAVILTT